MHNNEHEASVHQHNARSLMLFWEIIVVCCKDRMTHYVGDEAELF